MHFFQRLCPGAFLAGVALAIGVPAAAQADVVLAWNAAVAHYFITHPGETPVHEQARTCAMTHLAIEQAILFARGAAQPVGTPNTEQATAANIAAREVLTNLLPG